MGRRFAGHAEIAGGFHDARAEEFLPEAVDGHAGGQGIFRAQEPLSEAEPVARQVWRHGREKRGRVGFHPFAPLIVLAAVEHIGFRRVGAFIHDIRHRAALS